MASRQIGALPRTLGSPERRLVFIPPIPHSQRTAPSARLSRQRSNGLVFPKVDEIAPSVSGTNLAKLRFRPGGPGSARASGLDQAGADHADDRLLDGLIDL